MKVILLLCKQNVLWIVNVLNLISEDFRVWMAQQNRSQLLKNKVTD